MKRHLYVVPETEHDPLKSWPTGTLTAIMEGVAFTGHPVAVAETTRRLLTKLEPVVRRREVARFDALLDEAERIGVSEEQRELIQWLRRRSRA